MENNIKKDLASLSAYDLACEIRDILDNKLAHDIEVIDVEDKTSIAEYFVLCTGNSSTQVRALAGEVEYKLEEGGLEPLNVEGRNNSSWVLVDLGYVIVHIFSREARDFYNLDKLYRGTRIDIDNNEEDL